MTKKTLLIGIVLLMLFCTGFAYNIWQESRPSPDSIPEISEQIQTPQPIKVGGTVVCLEAIDTSGPQDLRCAIGLRDDNNNTYALAGVEGGNAGSALSAGKVTVEGTVLKPKTKYKSAGTITVTTIYPRD